MNESPINIHFFAGLGATHQGLRVIGEHLGAIAGVKQVALENSVLSTDPHTPNRFPSMADRILASYQKQQTTIIVLHSGAGGEFPLVFKHMLRKNPELVRDQLPNTHFVNIGVAGLRGGIDGNWNSLRRVIDVGRSQLSMPFVQMSPTEIAGIESLAMFDSHLLCPTLTEALRRLFPNRSNNRTYLRMEPYLPDSPYLAMLSTEAQEAVAKIDRQINTATGETETVFPDIHEMEELLKMRAKLLDPYSPIAWQGGQEYQPPTPDKPHSTWQAVTLAYEASADKIATFKTIIEGKLGKIYSQLLKEGFPASQLHFLVPEYDVFVTWSDLEKACGRWWTKEELLNRSVCMERQTHSSWATLGRPLAEAIQTFLEIT